MTQPQAYDSTLRDRVGIVQMCNLVLRFQIDRKGWCSNEYTCTCN